MGDRYVLAMLKEQGACIGGETSGHILCLDRATTGDALVSALQVLDVMRRSGRSLAQLAAGMTRFPQVLLNVPVARRFDPAAVPAIAAGRVAGWSSSLAGEGRVVLRASGHRAADPGDGGRAGRAGHAGLRRAHRRRRAGGRRPGGLIPRTRAVFKRRLRARLPAARFSGPVTPT